MPDLAIHCRNDPRQERALVVTHLAERKKKKKLRVTRSPFLPCGLRSNPVPTLRLRHSPLLSLPTSCLPASFFPAFCRAFVLAVASPGSLGLFGSLWVTLSRLSSHPPLHPCSYPTCIDLCGSRACPLPSERAPALRLRAYVLLVFVSFWPHLSLLLSSPALISFTFLRSHTLPFENGLARYFDPPVAFPRFSFLVSCCLFVLFVTAAGSTETRPPTRTRRGPDILEPQAFSRRGPLFLSLFSRS